MGNCSANNVQESTLSATNQGFVAQLMTSYTDHNNKAQMFNYESDKFHKHTYHIIHDCIVLSSDDHKKHIRALDHFTKSEDTSKTALFEVYKKHNYFKILPFCIEDDETRIQKNLWFVVRSAPHKKYHIRQKDILKFGRQKIKIRQIILEDHHLHNAIIDLEHMKTKKKVYKTVRMNDEEGEGEIISIVSDTECVCRICLEPGQQANPLICPCACIGSVRYLHIKCLRSWLSTRLNVEKKENLVVVKWTPMSCELCKSHFKYRVFLDNMKYYTLEIPKPEKPYIVLQVVGKTAEFSKIFLFASFSHKKTMSVGRGKDSDIQIKDLTISRHHSNISYDEPSKSFNLADHQSKYGTLVYIKKNMLVNPNQKHISFQIGNELFSFESLRSSDPFSEYHEQERFLNVIQKGSEDCLSSHSSENQELQEQIEDEISSEEEEAIEQAAEKVKMTKNVSNLSSIPTNTNLPELNNHSSTTATPHPPKIEELRIVQTGPQNEHS